MESNSLCGWTTSTGTDLRMQPDKASAASRQKMTARTPRIGESTGSIDSD
jgi:hypothetical protein